MTSRTLTGSASYTASKYGLLGFSRVLAEEMRPHGVRVGVLSAGATNTPLWDAVPGGGSPEQYLIEAGVTPGGLELPIQLTHSVERSFAAPVPNGVYFVRVRAVFAGSVGPRSEEIAIAVGTSLITMSWEGDALVTRRGAVESYRHQLRDGRLVGVSGYMHGEELKVVRNDDGSVNHLDLATFILTRIPYDPAAPIPGGSPLA